MAYRGVAAGAVAAAVIGAVGAVLAAVVPLVGQDGGGRPAPGPVVQSNVYGDNMYCGGQGNICVGSPSSATADTPSAYGSYAK